MFTYEELSTISNGLLALIRDVSAAHEKVNGAATHEAINNELHYIQSIHRKVCDEMTALHNV